MAGGAGDDVYVLNNAHDNVSDELNEGEGTVQGALSYILGSWGPRRKSHSDRYSDDQRHRQ
jgi:hypothetical protein